MIIVKLWGGLGNQFFQYAYGYSKAYRLGVMMKLDISYYEKNNMNQPLILKFNLKYKDIIRQEELSFMTRFLGKKIPNKLIRISPYFCMSTGSKYKYLKETRYRYIAKLSKFNEKNAYLDGYWQCPEYFQQVHEDLLKQFSIKLVSKEAEQLIIDIKQNNSVSLHIRRGDYINNNIFSKLVLLDKNYFDAALLKTNEVIVNPKYYIFTNDVLWVKQNYSDLGNSVIVTEKYNFSDLEEFLIMCTCKHQIISNSTFSWWAAYLNNNKDKIVISPEYGFGNSNILPEGWLRIMMDNTFKKGMNDERN